MKYIFCFVCLFISTVLSAQQADCTRAVKGRILSRDTNEALPFATVTIQNTDKGAITDVNGEFIIDNICQEELDLEIRFVGYKTVVHHHDFHHASPVIYMAPDETILESIIVEDTRYEELQSLAVQRKTIDKISLVSSSIAQMSQEISGVSMFQNGANISKPMIHGLHSNRVLVINDGVRHAYQVWGDEHGPEIDPSHVDRIEVVKGAGTVKYGPDALGGVILYNANRPELHKGLNGSAGASYQTNGRAIRSQLNVGQGAHHFAWTISGFHLYQGDLEAPDYTLSNTGKREIGGSFNTLLHRPKFETQISGSYFKQDLGILRASIAGGARDLQEAIDRQKPNPTFPFTYEIQNPRQATEHAMLKSNLSFFIKDHVLKFQYGIQRNVREEYDVRRGELNDRPVINLELVSHTLEAEWVQAASDRWSGNSGIQLYTQNSVNEPGSNPVNFVPDYDVMNLGGYTIQNYEIGNTTLELGARLDYQNLSVADTIRDQYIFSNELEFVNSTFTAGLRTKYTEEVVLFANLGTSWRPPNVAELYAFGYHGTRIQFGLWRYDFNPGIYTPVDSVFDQNLRTVNPEKGIKLITGAELTKGKVRAELILYANQINNFIYQRPFGVTVNIAGAYPYFIYEQTNALFLGSDWDVIVTHSPKFTSEAKLSYVYATSTEQNQPLYEIPPLTIDYNLKYQTGPWNYGLSLFYTARQWNEPDTISPIEIIEGEIEIDGNTSIFDFMPPPRSYLLLGLNAGFHKKHWNAEISIDNILNTSYRIYTDKLRYFADAPGRNVSISLQYTF